MIKVFCAATWVTFYYAITVAMPVFIATPQSADLAAGHDDQRCQGSVRWKT